MRPVARAGIRLRYQLRLLMQLLEREPYLAELHAALTGVLAGEGRVVLIGGEAGIGKTALVEQFARQRPAAARVLWGMCDPLFTPRPLGPLYDIATHLSPALTTLLNADANRTALFSAFLAELQGRPALVVFEDVHWADEATLDLLRFLSRRIARTSALLILTYRDDEMGAHHPLRLVLGDLATSSGARRLSLKPLTVAAGRVLAAGASVDPAVLHRRTGGNAFFVTESVAAGAESGLPVTVRDAVLARAGRLSPAARAVLEAAAVIGARVEPAILASVTGAEAAAVDECLAIGTLVVQGEGLAFRHELARQAILEAISPPYRLALHRRALDALRASPATRGDLARLAHHAEATGDSDAVLAYAPAAARQAAAARAHREAAALYALALRFAGELPPAEHAVLLEAYAGECNLIDQRAEGLAARRQALDRWRAAGDPVKEGGCLAQMAFLLNGLGNTAEAEQACAAALVLLAAYPPGPELALAYRVQAGLHMLTQNYRQSIEWGEKAIALAERFGDTSLVLSARNTIGTSWMFLDYEHGCQLLEANLARAHAAGLEALAAHAYANLSSLSGELYHFERAERYTSEGTAYTAERGLDHFRLYMLAWQAVTDVRLGRWQAAAEAAGLVLQRPGVSVTSRITALAALGYLYARRGEPDATPILDEALALSAQMTSLHRIGLVRGARAEAAWLAGDRQRARAEAQAVYDLAVSKAHPWITAELGYWRWRAGDALSLPAWAAEPYALQMAGDWRAAAAAWQALGCHYEQARALADGDAEAQAAAVQIFDQLGAQPAAAAVRQQMRAAGVRQIPRGRRATTRENPFSLTGRQLDILRLLAEDLSNAEIAARLHLSPKTVGHHVSAVLAKLDVHSREAAAELARRHPLLSQK